MERSSEYFYKTLYKVQYGSLGKEKLSEPYEHVPFTEMKKILEKAESLNKKEHGLQIRVVSELER